MMGQLTITLPDELEKEIRDYVAHNGYGGVSDFVREAVRQELQGISYWQRFTAVLALENNKLMRLATGRQWTNEALLEALRTGDQADYRLAAEIVSPTESVVKS